MSSRTNFPFFQDLKSAVVLLMARSVDRQCHFQSDYIHLHPPSQLLNHGCWCDDPSSPSPHNYTCCPHPRGPSTPSIVGQNPRARPCWHSTSSGRSSNTHMLFCFDFAFVGNTFMEWYMQPRTDLQGHTGLESEAQRDALTGLLRQCESHPTFDGWEGPTEEKYDVLCRLFVDMRRYRPTDETRASGPPWEAERVHALLGWRAKTFGECLAELQRAIWEAGDIRLSSQRLHTGSTPVEDSGWFSM
ncbi:hypothetical protein Trco_001557 [Trichoderma cornu-damae]|uniref:Uncharacterized protein n=1 Tax=Trichoderma cornu-damae TaxID=654480 RepID=A0A9P8QZ38_9HYPO|nr:hypothetical protein Trco_001557 [Trichoderma cornu-damae]